MQLQVLVTGEDNEYLTAFAECSGWKEASDGTPAEWLAKKVQEWLGRMVQSGLVQRGSKNEKEAYLVAIDKHNKIAEDKLAANPVKVIVSELPKGALGVSGNSSGSDKAR